MTGRPSGYTEELSDIICERLCDGESLKSICSEEGMPSRSMVFRWIAKHDDFRDRYAQAKQEQAEALADDIISIADETFNDQVMDANGNERTNNEAIQRSRLRVDARKWVAAKLKPKKYGDRQHVEHSGSIDSISDEELEERIRVLTSNDG